MKKQFLLWFTLLLSFSAYGSEIETVDENTRRVEMKFSFDSHVIRSSNYRVLGDVVELVNANINNISQAIKVDGYTDTIGDSSYNQQLSENRAKSVVYYMKQQGIQTNNFEVNGYGESTTHASNDANRRVEITIFLDGANSNDSFTDDAGSTDSFTDTSVAEPEANTQETVPAATYDQHRFGLSLAALNTELASEASGGATTDEVLSEVRVAGELNYSYYFNPSFYLKALGGIRWYEYTEDTQASIREDQTNWSYRFGLGLGYEIYEWWDANLMATYDSQLYYHASGPATAREIIFDLEPGVRVDLATTFRLFNGESWDFKLGFAGGYLFGADEIEGGFSYSVRPSIGLMRSRLFDLYALYQVNQFEVSTIDINHEILELGVSFNL